MLPPDIHRVIAVVLDGLRPDAIEQFQLANLRRIATAGASILHARSVSPSLTWPAITSFLTGVAPETHGILDESLHVPRPRAPLRPLPELLMRAGLPSHAFLAEVPFLHRAVASRIAERIGFSRARFSGESAIAVLDAARRTLREERTGLLYFHWFDADRAGHAHGWMSPEYGAAARTMDAALGELVARTGLASDRHTLLIAFADHGGGGGGDPKHHQVDHPLNVTIPVLMAGGSVQPRRLERVSLLDLPPTIAWALALRPPSSWTGRVIAEAFSHHPAVPAEPRSDQMSSAVPTASSWPTTTSPG